MRLSASWLDDKLIDALKNNALIFTTCGIIICLTIATSFTQLPIFPYGAQSQNLKLGVFMFLILLFSVVQFLFLSITRQMAKKYKNKAFEKFHLQIIYNVVKLAQFLLVGILVITLIQIITSSGYSIFLLITAVWITHITALGLLIELGINLLRWFKSHKDGPVLAFAIAVMTFSINLGVTLAYYTYESRGDDPLFITSFRGQVTSISSPYTMLKGAHFITYILSFVLIWLSSVVLLYSYSRKLGRIKFWIVLGIPIVYFVLQFQPSILNMLIPFRFSNPVLFGIVYTLVFTAAKPLGGILAGIAFWTVAKKINQSIVRNYMLLSACGIMLLFASTQAARLVTPPFPPIELAVLSFMPIASYYLIVGIYFSAGAISQDTQLRKYVLQSKKSIEKELGFLGSISSSEMEQEVQQRVEKVAKKLVSKMEGDSGIPTSLDEDEIREYIKLIIRQKMSRLD